MPLCARSPPKWRRGQIEAKSRTIFPNLRASTPAPSASWSIDAEGQVAAAGDADTPFSIQSISKVFTLTLALGMIGDRLWRRVGREPSGNPFNSIVQLEYERGRPRNPFINAGAIAVTDVILSGHQPREALGEILRFLQFVAQDTRYSSTTRWRTWRSGPAFEMRVGQLHEVLRHARQSRRFHHSASISIIAPSPCPAASWRWPGAISPTRAQSDDRIVGCLT